MSFQALQHPGEIRAFAALMQEQKIRSYLEIGSKFGGSLWRVVSDLPPPVKVVVVDLPRGTIAWPLSEISLNSCVTALRRRGHDVTLLWGDSTADDIVCKVKELGPYDAMLIDANHTRPYLEKDWANYGPLGKIVAFHDICWRRPKAQMPKVPIDVPAFWEVVKGSYFNVEIKLDSTEKDNGIGVLWRS